MLRGLLRLAQVLLATLIGYNLLVSLAGWRNPNPAVPGSRTRRFRIVIPAHNEEGVVARLVDDLNGQSYGRELFSISVIADRCSDLTAARARAAGAEVLERADGPDGKGAALKWLLDARPLLPEESLVVIDADNQVPANLLQRLSDEIEGGGQVMQAYLDVSNPDSSPLATAAAISYWASNRMVQLARHNLQWTADLGGTGMCITESALAAAGGFGDSLVEDQELGVRLFLSGHRVRWLHDVRIADEKPVASGVAMRQRARWVTGRRFVARTYFRELVRKWDPASWDLALRLVQPSRIGVALLSGGLSVASAVGVPLWSWWSWATMGLIQFLSPIPFLVRERVPVRYLVRYPLLAVLPLIKISARLIRPNGWYHTPHQGSDRSPSGTD